MSGDSNDVCEKCQDYVDDCDCEEQEWLNSPMGKLEGTAASLNTRRSPVNGTYSISIPIEEYLRLKKYDPLDLSL